MQELKGAALNAILAVNWFQPLNAPKPRKAPDVTPIKMITTQEITNLDIRPAPESK